VLGPTPSARSTVPNRLPGRPHDLSCNGGVTATSGSESIFERSVLEDYSKLSSHLSGVAVNLTDDVPFDFDVIAGTIQRYAHAATGLGRSDNPRVSDFPGVTRGHDLSGTALANAPTR
jgi:hypothetical protein